MKRGARKLRRQKAQFWKKYAKGRGGLGKTFN